MRCLVSRFAAVFFLLLLSACGNNTASVLAEASPEDGALPCQVADWIVSGKSLVIIDLSVVNDDRANATGVWSFQHLMASGLPGATKLGAVALDWIGQFGTIKSLNGYVVKKRPAGPLLLNWPRINGHDLDLTKAPLRLSAIAFRPDLRSAEAPAGEGRFVFGATDPATGTKNFAVILEFALPLSAMSIEAWDQAIARLSLRPFGDSYNAALAELTEKFAAAGVEGPHLMRVRTNEQYFGGGWDLREFHPDAAAAALVQVPVAQTPDISLNGAAGKDLVNWINANSAAIVAGDYKIPQKFLGGTAFLIDDQFAWFGHTPEIDPAARRAMALRTCNGCHGGETETRFLHVAPRLATQSAKLSPFLVKELKTRATALAQQVCE